MNGRMLGSRYEIIEKIGEGGMSIVYKAKDVLLNRIVAVKILREQYSSDQEFKERFRREAQSVASFSHSNIVNVYDVGEDQGQNYIVMELIDGEPLNEIIKREGMIDQDIAVLIVVQVLDALAHAHSYNVVHRDIKPHNIIVNKDGTAKITDFGIAKDSTSSGLTEAGTVMGTVNYTSPEQAKGKVATSESDLYSLGVVLYEMLTGKTPFTADTQVGVAIKHVQDPPIPPSVINSQVQKDLERVVLKALAKEPEDRWQDARFFKAALLRTSVGESIAKDRSGLLSTHIEPNYDDDNRTKKFNATEEVDHLANKKNQKTKKGSRTAPKKADIAVLVAIFLVIAAVTTVGIITYKAFKTWILVDEVTVPNVAGLTLEEAQSTLNALGLKTDMTRVYDPLVPEGYVVSQNPLANERKKTNSTVRLEVSLGTELISMPNLIGMTQREAELELERNDLKMGIISEDYSELVEEGKIMSQTPISMTRVAKGSTVDITVSLGAEPTPITVPSVVGMNVDEARTAIINAGFRIGNVRTEVNLFYAEGEVIGQNPGPAEHVQLGAYVDLVVCTKSSGSGNDGSKPSTSGGTNNNPSKSIYVPYTVSSHPAVQEIIIRVNDTFGVREVYGPTLHDAGDTITQSVEVYGNGKIEVISDGTVVSTTNVESN